MEETLHFLDYLKNTKKKKSLADRESEEITKKFQDQKNNEYFKHRNHFNRQRDEFNKV